MKIRVVQEITVPNGRYCTHWNTNVYCDYIHTEYANGCWIWRDAECKEDEHGYRLKCENCLKSMPVLDGE